MPALEGLTHQVAAAAYIFDQNRILLLKRNRPPYTFVPPGGRLHPNEDPVVGVHREVREETGLEIELLGVAHTWFGRITAAHAPLLAINYLAICLGGMIRLSEEHSSFCWVTQGDIENQAVPTLDAQGNGYQPRDLLDAFHRYKLLKQ